MDFVAWIRAGLKQPGKTQHGLAKRLGRADSAISAMLRDGRHIKAEEIIPIAEYLEIDPPFLPHKRFVPIIGCINSGVQLEVILFAENSLAQIAVPHGTVETQAALLVEGQGMPGLMKDGWAVFYGERQNPPVPEQVGELCVCEVAGGRIVVGFLKHSLYDRLYDIETGFEQYLLAQDIKWAATVTSLVTKAAVAQLRRAAEVTDI